MELLAYLKFVLLMMCHQENRLNVFHETLALRYIFVLEKALFTSLLKCVIQKFDWILFMKHWFCRFGQENVLATHVPQVCCVDIAYTRT